MKSLSDLAAHYDGCAQANEVRAEMILACMEAFAIEIRERQRVRAEWLTAEALELRAKAAAIRKLELQGLDEYFLNASSRT